MFTPHVESLDDGHTLRVSLLSDAEPLRFAEVVELWRHDAAFRAFFVDQLAEAPFPAYAWETPPVRTDTLDQVFEYVLVDSPELAGVHADAFAFAEHFEATDAGQDVVAFPNLGHDAFLVVPCPLEASSGYPHLATFAREAPPGQQHALWERVGEALVQRVGERPVWLSTAGLGVFWLHVRLDDRPKYYRHRPYREAR